MDENILAKDLTCTHLKTLENGIRSMDLLYEMLVYEQVDNHTTVPDEISFSVFDNLMQTMMSVRKVRETLGCDVK